MRTLDLESLEIFRTVVQEGGIVRAAGKLGRVQSNVTTRIKQLEQRLGRTLFRRQGELVQVIAQRRAGQGVGARLRGGRPRHCVGRRQRTARASGQRCYDHRCAQRKKTSIHMALILLEALGALLVLVLIVWWTMFSGRKGGELDSHVQEKSDSPPDETKRNT